MEWLKVSTWRVSFAYLRVFATKGSSKGNLISLRVRELGLLMNGWSPKMAPALAGIAVQPFAAISWLHILK
jgi:hypothetical protein